MTAYRGIMELTQNLSSRILIRMVRLLFYLANTADSTQSIHVSVLRSAFVNNFIVIFHQLDLPSF